MSGSVERPSAAGHGRRARQRLAHRALVTADRALVTDVIDLGTSVEVVVQMEGGLELISRSATVAVTRAGEACLVLIDPDGDQRVAGARRPQQRSRDGLSSGSSAARLNPFFAAASTRSRGYTGPPCGCSSVG